MSLRDRLGLNKRKLPSTPPPPTHITYSCGHNKPVEKLTRKPCPECREKSRQELHKQNKKVKKKPPNFTRLPDGSRFEVTYSASEKHWRGTLTVTLNGDSRTFTGEERVVFALLPSLDYQYRQWAKSAESPATTPDS